MKTSSLSTISILLAALIGTSSYLLQVISRLHMIDPLVLALLLGIVVRAALGDRFRFAGDTGGAVRLFLSIGIWFYAVENLNFARIAEVPYEMTSLVALVVLVYFGVILAMGKILGQRPQVTYLVATGSAICGASAIAITSPAVEAEADDVSVALLAVTLAALLGLFIVLPFLGALLEIPSTTFGLMSGAVLQFTGFVRESVKHMPHLPGNLSPGEVAVFAVSVKAGRYLGLLVAIPLFASLVRRKIYFPWYLWAFLGSGILGTWIYTAAPDFYSETLRPLVRPVHQVSWCIAMASLGLHADVRQLLSDTGVRAFWMALGGFAAALATFFLGLAFF